MSMRQAPPSELGRRGDDGASSSGRCADPQPCGPLAAWRDGMHVALLGWGLALAPGDSVAAVVAAQALWAANGKVVIHGGRCRSRC